MKRIIFHFSLLAVVFGVFPSLIQAQGVGINATGSSPDQSAALDIDASDKGVLFPRMTTSERDAIPSPADFLMILNTTTRCFEIYNAPLAAWENIRCLCTSLPESITALAATSPNTSSFQANWESAGAVNTYYLDVAGDAGFTTLIHDGLDVGNVTSYTVTGLDCATTYYYRVSAAGNCGTTPVSNVISVTLSECPFVCGNPISDIDGNNYGTVLIGSQCWMAANLRTTKNAAGNAVVRSCYDNNVTNCSTYGGLYTWAAMMDGDASSASSPSGVQGICPDGWHIPSHNEITALERAVCTSGSCATDFPYDQTTGESWRGTDEGRKLKSTSSWSGGGNGTNSSGFTSLPAGYYFEGSSGQIGNYMYLWSSTSEDAANAWLRDFYSAEDRIRRRFYLKSFSLSVRCIKD